MSWAFAQPDVVSCWDSKLKSNIRTVYEDKRRKFAVGHGGGDVSNAKYWNSFSKPLKYQDSNGGEPWTAEYSQTSNVYVLDLWRNGFPRVTGSTARSSMSSSTGSTVYVEDDGRSKKLKKESGARGAHHMSDIEAGVSAMDVDSVQGPCGGDVFLTRQIKTYWYADAAKV